MEVTENRQATDSAERLGGEPTISFEGSLESNDATVNRLVEEIAILRSQLQNKQENQVNPLPKTLRTDSTVDLSFIIPAYNAADYLEDCIRSIIDQGVTSYEIICIDDGSTDETPQILAKLVATCPQMRVITQKNQGLGATRNRAMGLARGRYIRFVDSDDLLSEKSSIDLINWADSAQLDILFFDADTLYDSEDLKERFPAFESTYKRTIAHKECVHGTKLFKQFKKEGTYRVPVWLALFKREFIEENRLHFPEGVIYEDNAFSLEAICLAKRVAHVNEPFYIRRVREGSIMTTAISAKNPRSYFEVYLEMLQFALQGCWDYETEQYIAYELQAIVKTTKNYYRNLNSIEREILNTLTPIHKTALQLCTSQVDEAVKREHTEEDLRQASQREQQVKEELSKSRSELESYKQEAERLTKDLARAQDEIRECKKAVQQFKEELEHANSQLEESKTEAEHLKNKAEQFEKDSTQAKNESERLNKEVIRLKESNSWKVGRTITAPVRLIKRSMQGHSKD